MVDRHVEIPRTDAFRDGLGLEVFHEFQEAGLGCLRRHSGPLDVADLLHGRFLLGGWERFDVCEDVVAFRYAERRAHLYKHVGLRETGVVSLVRDEVRVT